MAENKIGLHVTTGSRNGYGLTAQSQYLPGLDSHQVGFVDYDHDSGRLSYEPAVPVPTLVTLLAERQGI